jgi:hypothetical protein
MTTSIFLRLILGFEHGNNTPLNKGASIFLVDFFDALSSASPPKIIAFVDSCHQCT